MHNFKTGVQIIAALLVATLSGIGIYHYYDTKPHPKYVGLNLYTHEALTEVCEEVSESSCGITFSSCATPRLTFNCLTGIAIIRDK